MKLLDEVDPRLQPMLRDAWGRRRPDPREPLPRDVTVVLAGHRAAGKTRLLPHVAKLLGREGLDLDAELARRSGRDLREWVTRDEAGFRAAERETFRALPRGLVVAVGGGFLALHAEALRGCVVVEVPVSFETYRERLLADASRPRLRPELSPEEELREVYAERSARHAQARPLELVEFLLRAERGLRPQRVVTLPPHTPIEVFAWKARHAGAELLEVRSDLQPAEIDLLGAARALPLLVARRTPRLPQAWQQRATLLDAPLEPGAVTPGAVTPGDGAPGHGAPGHVAPGLSEPVEDRPTKPVLYSFHADAPLTTEAALARWRDVPVGARVKHVEPLGSPRDFPRLLATQRALLERFGPERVTVLATGPLALPFRAVLAQKNALDYLALDGQWAAAPGQRLLVDAVREARHARGDGLTRRLGILGHRIGHSRSPRIHRQPFDRIDLPPDAPLGELLDALRPHYRGFAVTNPFKKPVAALMGDDVRAVNTLVRGERGWNWDNSDVAGANAMLDALGPIDGLTVLGDGGVTEALRQAAAQRDVPLRLLRREDVTAQALGGTVVWSWPATVTPPEALRFADARVVVVAYGEPARVIAGAIRARGGQPLRLGPRWFIAQARQQRSLWESAL